MSADRFCDLAWLCITRNMALHGKRDFAIRWDNMVGKIVILTDGEDGEMEDFHPIKIPDLIRSYFVTRNDREEM